MIYEKALIKFQEEIASGYGVPGVFRICVEQELYDRIIMDMVKDCQFSGVTASSLSNVKVYGVELVPRAVPTGRSGSD